MAEKFLNASVLLQPTLCLHENDNKRMLKDMCTKYAEIFIQPVMKIQVSLAVISGGETASGGPEEIDDAFINLRIEQLITRDYVLFGNAEVDFNARVESFEMERTGSVFFRD